MWAPHRAPRTSLQMWMGSQVEPSKAAAQVPRQACLCPRVSQQSHDVIALLCHLLGWWWWWCGPHINPKYLRPARAVLIYIV